MWWKILSEQEQVQVFKLITKAKGFKALASTLTSFVDEAVIILNEEGLKTITLDVSRKEQFVLAWNKEKFEQFDVPKEFKLIFHVNTFAAIMRRFKEDDDIIVESTKKNSIIFTQPRTKKEFDCNLLSNLIEVDRKLDVKYSNEFELKIQQLEEMISDSEVFQAEQAWLISKDGKLCYEGKEDAGTAKGVLLEDYNEDISNTAFRFEYLKPFLSSIKPYVDEKVKVQVGPQKPLHLVLDLGEGIGFMEYFLAPMFN